MNLKVALLSLVAATSVTSGAFAADMPVKARVYTPPAFNWSGLYVGGFVGGA